MAVNNSPFPELPQEPLHLSEDTFRLDDLAAEYDELMKDHRPPESAMLESSRRLFDPDMSSPEDEDDLESSESPKEDKEETLTTEREIVVVKKMNSISTPDNNNNNNNNHSTLSRSSLSNHHFSNSKRMILETKLLSLLHSAHKAHHKRHDYLEAINHYSKARDCQTKIYNLLAQVESKNAPLPSPTSVMLVDAIPSYDVNDLHRRAMHTLTLGQIMLQQGSAHLSLALKHAQLPKPKSSKKLEEEDSLVTKQEHQNGDHVNEALQIFSECHDFTTSFINLEKETWHAILGIASDTPLPPNEDSPSPAAKLSHALLSSPPTQKKHWQYDTVATPPQPCNRLDHSVRMEVDILLSQLCHFRGVLYHEVLHDLHQAALAYEECFPIKLQLCEYTLHLETFNLAQRSPTKSESQPSPARSMLSQDSTLSSKSRPIDDDDDNNDHDKTTPPQSCHAHMIATPFNIPLEMGHTLHNLGCVYLDQEKVLRDRSRLTLASETWSEAIRWKKKALEGVFGDAGISQSVICASLANSVACLGDALLYEALEPVPVSTAIRSENKSPDVAEAIWVKKVRSIQEHKSTHLKEALTLYQQALSMVEQEQDQPEIMMKLACKIGSVYLHLQDYSQALIVLQDCANRQRSALSTNEDDAASLLTLNLECEITTLKSWAEMHQLLGQAMYHNGYAKDAVRQLKRAYDLYCRVGRQCRMDGAKTEFYLAQAFLAASRNVQAKTHFSRITGYKAFGEAHPDILIEALVAVSDLMLLDDQNEDLFALAIKGYQSALEKCLNCRCESAALVYHRMGLAYASKSIPGEEEDYVHSSSTGLADIQLQCDDISLSDVNHFVMALTFLEEAANVYKCGSNSAKEVSLYPKEYSAVLEHIGELYHKHGQHPKAIQYFTMALSQISSNNDELSMSDSVRVSRMQNSLGLLYYRSYAYQSSRDAFQQSLDLKRAQLEYSKSIDEDNDSMVTTIVNLGHAHYKLGLREKALVLYQEALSHKQSKLLNSQELSLEAALDILQVRVESHANKATKSESAEPSDGMSKILMTLSEVASTLNYMGIVQQDQGDMMNALSSYRKLLRIRQILLTATPDSDPHQAAVAISAERVGLLQFQRGLFDEALDSFTEALRVKKLSVNSSEDLTVDIAHTMNSIGNVLYSKGDLDRSMAMYRRALDVKRLRLGNDHVDVANTLNNIGNVFHAKGDYGEAVNAYSEALNIKRLQLGTDHLDVAATYSNIGDVQVKRKQYLDALTAYEETLRIRRAVWGEDKPNLEIANILASIAKVLQLKGSPAQALEALEEELDIRRAHFTENHAQQDTALDLSLIPPLVNLGRAHHRLGNHDEALLTYKEAVTLHKHKLKDLEDAISVTSTTTDADGKFGFNLTSHNDRAHRLAHHSEALGQFSATLRNIGLVYQDKGDLSKALNAFKASHKYKKQQLGENSMEVAVLAENIALCFFSQNQYKNAIASFFEALRVKKINLGEDSDEYATTLNNLGNVYYTIGNLAKAMEHYAKAFLIKKSLLGDDHVDLATMLNNIASIYAEESNINEAIETYQESLRIRKAKLGNDDLLVASTYLNLGDMCVRKQALNEALEHYRKTMRIRVLHFGQSHLEVALVFDKMALAYESQKEWKRAIEMHYDSAKMKETLLGKVTLEYAATVEKIAHCQLYLKKIPEAQKCLKHVLHVRRKRLEHRNDDHQDIQAVLIALNTLRPPKKNVTTK